MPDRQPLLTGWGERTAPSHVYDHDAERLIPVGEGLIAFTAHAMVRRPSAWKPRIYMPNKHGVMCEVGRITTTRGVFHIRMWPHRLLKNSGSVNISRLPSEQMAVDMAEDILRRLFP